MSKCAVCGVEITGEHVQWPVSGPAHMDKAACVEALRASLAAAEAKLADEVRHADALESHLQSLQDCGYEFRSPGNCDRVDDLLAAHAARRAGGTKEGA